MSADSGASTTTVAVVPMACVERSAGAGRSSVRAVMTAPRWSRRPAWWSLVMGVVVFVVVGEVAGGVADVLDDTPDAPVVVVVDGAVVDVAVEPVEVVDAVDASMPRPRRCRSRRRPPWRSGPR